MQLKERERFLERLRTDYQKVLCGEGHTVFVSGEAGIGKTSLVRTFGQEIKPDCIVLQGVCDALFTPRPLAPVLDVMRQLGSEQAPVPGQTDRPDYFSRIFLGIERQTKPVILIFEDAHWADEASIDFIKFFARRISQLRCLFILTFRDSETDALHPLSAVPGQLDPDSFSQLKLIPLSRAVVEEMSVAKGFDGSEVFAISGGNPFYVNEILASYSAGVPEKVKDSVLSVFHRQDWGVQEAWKFLSALPQGLPLAYGDSVGPEILKGLERSLESGILVVRDGKILFKHELYRRTIEVSLSPLLRISLNKKMLVMVQTHERPGEGIEQLIHFAKNANEPGLVVTYAPEAARKAALLGAHIEAGRLFMSAIEYYKGNDPAILLSFYQGYAYECYLTNRIDEAIIYTGKAFTLLKDSPDTAAAGNSLRFLSRLWWYAGNREKAEKYGLEAIEVFEKLPSSPEKGMAFSNMSQLKMLSDDLQDCLQWGNRAIAIARSIGDNSTLSHALNNTGTIKMLTESGQAEGETLLRVSLQIALDFGYHEHAARAFTNLGSNSLYEKNYPVADEILGEGIRFCEARDLDSWSVYMSSMRARLCLETGRWVETRNITSRLLINKLQAPVSKIIALIALGTLQLREGHADALGLLLEALEMASVTREPQRLIPALVALLEWEWINDKEAIAPDRFAGLLQPAPGSHDLKQDELGFWMFLSGKIPRPANSRYSGYAVASARQIKDASRHWENLGNHYQQALCLFLGDDEDKRAALELVLRTSAITTAEKMKREMRLAGLRNIPRGLRRSTRENPSQLTSREIELLPLLKEGLQNKEIASRLFISPKTVDHHISSIYFKLDVKSRASAVQEALRLRIIK